MIKGRRLGIGMVLSAVITAGASAQGGGSAAGSAGHAGRGTGGSAGWAGTLECLQCTVHLSPTGTWVQFGAEPIVRGKTGDGSSLIDGDMLVAVDDILITTAAGGRRLASIDAQPTRFTIRRDGREIVLVTQHAFQWTYDSGGRGSSAGVASRTATGTGTGVRGGDGVAGIDTSVHAGRDVGIGRGVGQGVDSLGRMNRIEMNVTNTRGWLGLALDCLRCTTDRVDRSSRDASVRFTTPPKVVAVEPGAAAEAGFKSGDLIRTIDGMPMTSDSAAVRFSSLRAGQRVKFVVERKGQPVLLTLVVPKAR